MNRLSTADRARLSPPIERARSIARWVLAATYLAAGVLHVMTPHPFLTIMPRWVPFPDQVVLVTGLCEIAGSIALATRRLRPVAGVMLALYALCVYPANVQHAINDLALGQPRLGWWYHAPRLALQPLIIWWALFAGRVIDWPFGRGD